MTIPPNIKYQELFVEAEKDARENYYRRLRQEMSGTKE